MFHSIVEYYADSQDRCGYCKSSNTHFSHGMWAHSMTVSDYQDLIDRGWRRCGKYCYKPTMDVTCCPMYTIRCRALEFKATKSQKKVLKRFNKYVVGQDTNERSEPTGDGNRKMSTCSSEADMAEGVEQFLESTNVPQKINISNIVKADDEEGLEDAKDQDHSKDEPKVKIASASTAVSNPLDKSKPKEMKKGEGYDPAKAPNKKAKQLRLERKMEKLKEKGIDINSLSNINKNKEKEVEDFINELPNDVKHKLEIKLVRTAPPSPEWEATMKETCEVYAKYQTIIHNDKPEKCTPTKFLSFLVQSPLLEEHSESAPPFGYGSFHQQYWLDGKLIAVGVIDILPKCVSSVYFFYDPAYTHLTLGTYGALREIAFTRQLQSVSPALKYYYMGYYIHSCKKMRYKGNFYPSDLACPETYKWFPLKDCIPKLEVTPYSRLDPDIDSVDDNHPKADDINYVPVLAKGVVMPYKTYKRKSKKSNFEELLLQYSQLVGVICAKRMIIVSQ
ncbi:arginyl-tRNA--protein transferase 1 [Cydia pomonella]|uniref:arginyl-tRNA--protein transferase 1 n=1 Tax=Cydia pomonella TaxID=82600 RepID=UPI002ADDE770|nr:arginyl-tRNA--protein transferase 1 [Cydia pomonella]